MAEHKHIPGPLRRCGHDRGGCPCRMIWSVSTDRPVATVEQHPGDMPSMSDEEADAVARLIAAAYTSYDKHCGERAVECAEGDLLGKLLHACEETLRDVECRFDGIDFEVIERRLSDVLAKGGAK